MDLKPSREQLVVAGVSFLVGALLAGLVVFGALQPLSGESELTGNTVWISGTIVEIDTETDTLAVVTPGEDDDAVTVAVGGLAATGGMSSCTTQAGTLRCTPVASLDAIENGTQVCVPAYASDDAVEARQVFANASCTAGLPS